MIIPNFLIIGAPKAGTTSLYQYLRQHPDVFMPANKEPYYFAKTRTEQELSDYLELFAARHNARAVGEASTNYLFRPQAPRLIHAYNKEMRLVAVLRNPVDRAFSQYHHNIKLRLEPHVTFEDALAAEEAGDIDRWFLKYVEMGLYAQQLRRYLEVFPREQILVILYDDLRTQLPAIVKRLFGFLGVDDEFAADVSVRHNPTRVPKSRGIDSLVHVVSGSKLLRRSFKVVGLDDRVRRLGKKLRYANSTPLPSVNPQTRQRLVDRFRSDCLDLQSLLDRDLSSWMKVDHPN